MLLPILLNISFIQNLINWWCLIQDTLRINMITYKNEEDNKDN